MTPQHHRSERRLLRRPWYQAVSCHPWIPAPCPFLCQYNEGTLLHGDKLHDSIHRSSASMSNHTVPMASAVTSSDDKQQQELPAIAADQARALLSSGHGYVDVRMQEDFDKGHAAGARNVPYYLSVTPQGKEKNPRFEEEVAALCGKDETFIVGCNTGNRSRFATADLLAAGFKNVRNLDGGYRSFLQSENQHPPQQQ